MKVNYDLLLLQYKIHADSPYNDGWTQEFYREQIKKLEKKLKRKKRAIQDKKID